MKYQIASDNRVAKVKDIFVWAKRNGFDHVGFATSASLRKELQGQPKFLGLAGPMWNGEGVIRYEDWQTYARLSV